MSTVTVVPTVELSNVPPRVRLDVTDTGTSPSIFATTVTRQDPDGVARTVRTPDGNPLVLTTSGANRVGLVYDYAAPYGQPVSYSTQESPTTVSAEVTVDETRTWLLHPGVPAVSQPIVIADLSDRARKIQQGVFYPMGRSTPVVQNDGARRRGEYTLSVWTPDLDARDLIDDLLADGSPLLLNVPVGKGWGLEWQYVAVGDVTERRPVRFLGESGRFWDLPITIVDPPVGGSQSGRSYADLLTFPTYAALDVAYSSYNQLLAGP
jgi:hypothetical protein